MSIFKSNHNVIGNGVQITLVSYQKQELSSWTKTNLYAKCYLNQS